jgi:hypothetical protein
MGCFERDRLSLWSSGRALTLRSVWGGEQPGRQQGIIPLMANVPATVVQRETNATPSFSERASQKAQSLSFARDRESFP